MRREGRVAAVMLRRLPAWALCAGLLAACGSGEEESEADTRAAAERQTAAAATVTRLADTYVAAYFDRHPEAALIWGAPDPDPGRLTDNGLEALARWQILEQDLLAELDAVPAEDLVDPAARVTADLLRHRLASSIARAVCRDELWHVSPTWTSWLAGITVLAGKLPMATPAQQADALNRVRGMADYVDTERENLADGVETGYTAARSSVAATVRQLDEFLALPLEDTPFMVAAAGADIPFREQLAAVVETDFLPSVRRYRDYLERDYLPAAREPAGVSANPDGAACYRASVRYWATVDLGPRDIHRIGLEQMDRIMAELSAIGARSFDEPDALALLARVRSEPQYLFTTRAEMVAWAEAAVERARQGLPEAFGRIPRAPVIVEPYPEFQERSAPGGQAVPPAADGSAPGKYLINTYQPERQSRAALEATAFHEAWPGHHMQVSIAQERADLHPISRYFFLSGFGEGWGLYAERLADELGWYSSDLDRVGMLANEAWRAARLVVDSGLHGMGWSRDEALAYLDAHSANAHELNAAEVDRYIAVPGQATSYLLGALEFRRLREHAETQLGDRFDLRAFHDRVLEDGAIPLDRLGAKVDDWIATHPDSGRP